MAKCRKILYTKYRKRVEKNESYKNNNKNIIYTIIDINKYSSTLYRKWIQYVQNSNRRNVNRR